MRYTKYDHYLLFYFQLPCSVFFILYKEIGINFGTLVPMYCIVFGGCMDAFRNVSDFLYSLVYFVNDRSVF